MPAQAGIQTKLWGSSDPNILDSRIRGNDGFGNRSLGHMSP
jgi:hypothetical protein